MTQGKVASDPACVIVTPDAKEPNTSVMVTPPLPSSAAKTSAPASSRPLQILATLLAALSGTLLVTQNGVNTNLKLHVIAAPFPTSFINFSVGLVTISTIAMLHKPKCNDTTLRSAPWYAWTGGLMGPVYVTTAIVLSRQLGFAAFQLCAIAGQLLASLSIDGVGLLHMKKRKLTCRRVVALVGVFVGAALTSSASDIPADGVWWAVIYAFCAVGAGSMFPLQSVVVGAMQAHVKTPFRAVTTSFFVGSITTLLISVASMTAANEPLEVDGGEPWMWTGGMLGAGIVTCNVVGTPLIGAASYVTTFLTSQLIAAFVYDSFGAFGFEQRSPTVLRLLGVAVAIFAAAMFQLSPSGEVLADQSNDGAGPVEEAVGASKPVEEIQDLTVTEELAETAGGAVACEDMAV